MAISEETRLDITNIAKLSQIKKRDISYIAVLNLQFVQKLNFILVKVEQANAECDVDFIRDEIKYWEELILESLLDTSEEMAKYGNPKSHTHLQAKSSNGNTNSKLCEEINQSISSENSAIQASKVENSKP